MIVKLAKYTFSRNIIIHAVNTGLSIIIARYYGSEILGYYAISLFLISLFNMTFDFGIGNRYISVFKSHVCSIVRAREFVNTFSFFIFVVLAILIFLYQFFFNIANDYITLVSFLLMASYLQSVTIIPTAHLESQLLYKEIAIIEVSQNLVFATICICLLYFNFGIFSFGLAFLAKSLISVGLLNKLISLEFSFKSIRSYPIGYYFDFYFGGVKLMSLIKDSLNPLLIGALVGVFAVGEVQWAIMMGTIPVVFLGVLQRVGYTFNILAQYNQIYIRRNLAKFFGSFLLFFGS
jgi:O-antigen/teichoic acid export membrane protein